MEPKGSLPYSQKPANGPRHEFPIFILQDPF
jgi:hypothetical protein